MTIDQVDGLVVNTTGENDEYRISLHERGVPLVLADRCLSAPGVLDTVAAESCHITSVYCLPQGPGI